MHYEQPPNPELLGGWIPTRQMIVIAPGLPLSEHEAVLAHELGHAVLGHRACAGGRYRRQEESAWEWAARRLIDPRMYERVERFTGPHPGALAVELGTSPHVVLGWQRVLSRLW